LTITSLVFAGFVAFVLAGYYLLPRRAQNIWLLLASCVFYITWSGGLTVVLAAFTLANYAIGLALGRTPARRSLLWFGIALNIATLVVFKYGNFFIKQAQDLLTPAGNSAASGALNIILPLGLSYLVLQTISYLLDVSRKQMEPIRNLIDFALYLAYFPKLIAGPIERARTFLPILENPRHVDDATIARSTALILTGLIRKLILADLLSSLLAFTPYVRRPDDYSLPELFFWLLAHTFALYNDFAGYTNIARGVSGLFGIDLSPNFAFPLFSRNFTEFWNRWHISLSHWLRDYIYTPLSRALLRRGYGRSHILSFALPPLLTMLSSALWHYVSWPMLIWGLMNGVYLIADRIPIILGKPVVPPDTWPLWRQVLGAITVVILWTLSNVPFTTSSLTSLEQFVTQAFSAPTAVWDWPDVRIVAIIIPSLALDAIQARCGEYVVLSWPRPVRATVLAFAVLVLVLVTRIDWNIPPFVYQGF
jgi:alginate O-acetyltransferase complex protein AlgI